LGQETDVPGEDLPDVPRYPGAVRTKYAANPFLEQKSIKYRTAADIGTVQSFYVSQLPGHGWLLTYENAPYFAEKFINDNMDLVVFVDLDSAEGYTVIKIDRNLVSTGQISDIPARENGELSFDNFPITSITLTAGEVGIPSASFRVMLQGEPAEIPVEAWEVYAYVDITDNMENIEAVTIRFKVLKQWISAKNIDLAKVRLLQLDEQWKELPTSMISEDDEYVYFSANTTGFSIFVLAGKAYSVPTWYAQPLNLTLIALVIIAVLGAVYWLKLRR
jgi:PGF-pre-PGF domain-containing protein